MAETRRRSTSSEGRSTRKSASTKTPVASTTRERSSSSRSSRNENPLIEKLSALGVNEQMIEGVKTYVVHSVEGKLREFDVEEAVEKVGEYAKKSMGSVKRYSSNRPGLFYGGLLTVALGAGLLIGAAIERELEYELDFEPEP